MDEDEPIRIATGDVTVTKGYEAEEFAVPTMCFEIRSERNTAVEIRLEERVPKGFPVEGIGFHPEYDSECWTTYPDGRLVFESRLEPETTLVTVYGVRIDVDGEARAFMTEPEFAVSEVDGTDERTDDETPILADGAGETAAVPITSVTSADVGSAVANEAGGIAAALAAELRPRSVTKADRETIREALGPIESESERVQIDHLQSRVSELEAYTEAFESFLDENGTGDRLVSELRGGLADLRGTVKTLESEFETAMERHGSTIESLESDLDSFEGTIGERDEIAADIDAVSDDLDALYEQVADLLTWRDRMGVAFGTV